MKAGKKILKWAIIFCLSFVTFNLFISSDYEFERSIEINASSDIVFNQVTDLHNWPNWAVWWKNDSTIVTEFNEVKSGEGSSMEWKGEESGVGGLEIISCSIDAMETSLDFGDMKPTGFWKFEEIDSRTKVTWGMKGEMPFLSRFMTLFIDEIVGSDFDNGLKGLKKVCEIQPSGSHEVEL